MKRMLCLLLAMTLFVGGCAGAPSDAGATEPPAASPPLETAAPNSTEAPAPTLAPDDGERMRFTDSLGREIDLPAALTRLIPATAQAQQALYTLSSELMAEWGGKPQGIRVGPREAVLPSGDLADFDWNEQFLATFKESGAQAMLIMGTGMDAAAVDSVQEAVGMPVLYIDAEYEALAMSYLTLGGLFGLEQEAQDIYLYLDTSLMELSDGTQEIPDEQRQRVYYGSGADGLTASGSDALLLAGCVNVAEPGKTYTVEALKALEADQFIFSNEGVFATIMQSETWNAISAVSMGLYYEIPFMEFDWISNGSQTGRVLGAKWLASLLYPDRFPYDMVEEARMFYDLFYHIQMTTEEAEALLGNSSLKPIG